MKGREDSVRVVVGVLRGGGAGAVVGARGAGKTSFLRAIQEGLTVSSPTTKLVCLCGDEFADFPEFREKLDTLSDGKTVVILDDADRLLRDMAASEEASLREAIVRGRVRLLLGTTWMPSPRDEFRSSLMALFHIVRLDGIDKQGTRSLFTKLIPDELALECVATHCDELLGGLPRLIQMFGRHLLSLWDTRPLEPRLIEVATDLLAQDLEAWFQGRDDRQLLEYLVQNDFCIGDIPDSLEAALRNTGLNGFMRLDGLRARPAAPIYLEFIGRSISPSETVDGNLGSIPSPRSISWEAIAAVTELAVGRADFADILGSSSEHDGESLSPIELIERRVREGTLSRVEELLVGWMGIRERRAIASQLGIASVPSDPSAAARTIMAALRTREP